MFYKKACMLVMVFLCQHIRVSYCDVFEITQNSAFIEWCRNNRLKLVNLVTPNVSNDLVDEGLNDNEQFEYYAPDSFWSISRFKQFIQDNCNIAVHDKSTFSDFFACYKDKAIAWQQAGCALFVPFNDQEIQPRAYVALKRPTEQSKSTCNDEQTPCNDKLTTCNNKPTTAQIFSYEHHIHTERQLAIVALENALSEESLHTDSDGIIVPYLKQHINELAELREEKRNNLCGTLYLYTQSSPCRTPHEHNDFEYYAKLIKMFPRVTFKIFFNKERLQLSKNIKLNKKQLQRINLETKRCEFTLNLDTNNTLSSQYKKNCITKMKKLLDVAASKKSTYEEDTLSKSIKYLHSKTQEMLFNVIYKPSEKKLYHLVDM